MRLELALATLGGAFSAGASPSSGETSIGIGGLVENADKILAIAADVVQLQFRLYRGAFATAVLHELLENAFTQQTPEADV